MSHLFQKRVSVKSMPTRLFAPEVIRVYAHDPTMAWNDTNWPRVWSNRLRQFFTEEINKRSDDVAMRAELLRLLNAAEQVRS